MSAALTEDFWMDAPVLFDVIASDGTILYANATETDALGLPRGSLTGKDARTIYTASSVDVLQSCLRKAEPGDPHHTLDVPLTMRTRSSAPLTVLATLNFAEHPVHGVVVRAVKRSPNADQERIARLESENDILSGIIATARDATYCVEFLDPVDLTAPEHEIIRQVFENPCRWRFCNEAMARLYQLPHGEDPNSKDVRDIFPRNPDNETFVRTMIEAGWHIDGARSRDHRYDGADMYVSNDVRAHITDGRLHRFWGVLRDHSSRILKERHLKAEADQALDLLGAVPDPILVVNRNGRIEGANPALEAWLGLSLNELLGTKLETVLKFEASMAALMADAGPGKKAIRRSAIARCSDGTRLTVDANVATIATEEPPRRMVMTLRMSKPQRRPATASTREARNG